MAITKHNIELLRLKPLFALTVDEFIFILESTKTNEPIVLDTVAASQSEYAFGIKGIAEIFNCSKTTANAIKQSGRIDKAITQLGRKIVVNRRLAIELINKKNKN
jgi:hypothetical protein